MFIKISYTFLDSNSIYHKCFASALMGEGEGSIGAPYFSICQDDILRACFTKRALLPRRGGIQEKRKRNQHHNTGIKEHDISYLDATNEISLTMFSDISPFPANLAPLKCFFLWNPYLRFKLHGALLFMLIYFPLFFFLSFFFLVPLSFFFLSFSFFSSFSSLSPSFFHFLFLFSFFFGAPFVTEGGGAGLKSPSEIRPWVYYSTSSTTMVQLSTSSTITCLGY